MRLVLIGSGGAVLAGSLAAHADTLTESLVQSFGPGGVSGTIEDFGGIAHFDPALGTLNSVTQSLTGNFTFTPTAAGAFYEFNVNGPDTPIQSLIFGYSSDNNFEVSVTSEAPSPLEESTDIYGPQYTIEPFDILVDGGVLQASGPITDSFTFNYTPAVSAAPEPASYLLLGTGLLGVAGVMRKRFA